MPGASFAARVGAAPAVGYDGNPRYSRRASYAALDLGTNNCRLLVAKPSGDSFIVVDAFSRIVHVLKITRSAP